MKWAKIFCIYGAQTTVGSAPADCLTGETNSELIPLTALLSDPLGAC